MWKILGLLVCLAIVVFAVTIVFAQWSHWRFRLLSRERVPTICISCQGKGWIAEHQRTLTFEQGGFVDGPERTHPCEACGGTGTIYR